MRQSLLMSALYFVTCTALACQCEEPEDISTAFQHSDVVVVARSISAHTEKGTNTLAGDSISVELQDVEWVVQKYWKGPYQEGMHFHTKTVVTCCLCGKQVAAGQVMLLYLPAQSVQLEINSCGRSSPYREKMVDIAVLDTLKKNGVEGRSR
jgi:hypothetical protein